MLKDKTKKKKNNYAKGYKTRNVIKNEAEN